MEDAAHGASHELGLFDDPPLAAVFDGTHNGGGAGGDALNAGGVNAGWAFICLLFQHKPTASALSGGAAARARAAQAPSGARVQRVAAYASKERSTER